MALWDDLNLDHPITIYDSSIGLEQSYYSDSFASHRLSYNRGDVVLPSVPTNEPLLEEIKHFLDVISGKETNRSSGIYGTKIVQTLQAADQSLLKKGKFVSIDRSANQLLISRTAKFLLSLPWWLFSLRSNLPCSLTKSPNGWLYSTPKILFIVISITSCSLFFYFIKKLVIPKCFLTYCENLETRNIVTFLVISIISSLPFLTNGVKVGEDIGGQVKSSLQWINGEVNAPNILSEPRREDLSTNQEKWSLRPPGAAILPTFGMLLGLSLGQSIKLGLLFCSVTGGAGWLIVFKKFNVDKHFIFIAAISLGLKTGTSVSEYATANIILFALVPWFLLLNFLISERFRTTILWTYLIIAVFLFPRQFYGSSFQE